MKKFLLLLFLLPAGLGAFAQNKEDVPPPPPPPPDYHNGQTDTNALYNNGELGVDQADFPGGIQELYKFLQKNIHYPKKEQENGIQGKVYITFVIEKDGSIGDVQVLKGVPGGPALDEEAVRVVKMMPRWTPGKQNGKPVRVKYQLPIKFSLGGDTPPQYPGGTDALAKYLSNELVYPKPAKKHKTEGVVIVTFEVDPNGNIVNPVVQMSLGDGCDEEALRLVKNMPKWIPGSDKTKNHTASVNVKFELKK